MTPADIIAAAITKLTEQRAEAHTGPWFVGPGGACIWTDGAWVIGDATLTETADLIVTLHATIDAQLAILHQTLKFAADTWLAVDEDGPVFSLARAILGEQVNA